MAERERWMLAESNDFCVTFEKVGNWCYLELREPGNGRSIIEWREYCFIDIFELVELNPDTLIFLFTVMYDAVKTKEEIAHAKGLKEGTDNTLESFHKILGIDRLAEKLCQHLGR